MALNDYPFVSYMKPMFFSKENETVEMSNVPVILKLEPKCSKMPKCSCPHMLANSVEYLHSLFILSVPLGGAV